MKELRKLEEIVGKIEKDKGDLESLIKNLRDDNIQVNLDKNKNFRIILGKKEKVIFPSDSSSIRTVPELGKKTIMKIGKKLKEFLDEKGDNKFSIMIEGYTDTKGMMDDNYVLSYNRAKNIMKYLREKCALDPDIIDITPVGFGELKSKLKSSNKADNTNSSINRRVEIRIIPKFSDLVEYLLNKEEKKE